MFDENFKYQKNDVDLMQLISESMLEISFDVSNLPTLARIEELSSNEKNESTREMIVESIETSYRSKKKKFLSNQQNLLSSSPTFIASENSENSNPFLTSEENSENSDFIDIFAFVPPPANSKRKFAPSTFASKNIIFKIDESNIISEGVKRQRQFKKQAYATALNNAGNGRNETFHATFEAHLNVNQYYVQENSQNNQKTSSSNIKFHKNILFSEFQHFEILKNHSHADEFKRAMETEIAALKSKST